MLMLVLIAQVGTRLYNLHSHCCLERFSIECRKTKLTKVITLTNHNRRKQKKDQPEFEANACNPRQARENACERGMIGLGFAFASHWLRKWREFC